MNEKLIQRRVNDRRVLFLVALMPSLAFCLTARGAEFDTVWTGGATGNWIDPTWDNGVPNNGGGDFFSAFFFSAFIDNNPLQDTTITISPNGTITIDSVTIDAGDILDISNNT